MPKGVSTALRGMCDRCTLGSIVYLYYNTPGSKRLHNSTADNCIMLNRALFDTSTTFRSLLEAIETTLSRFRICIGSRQWLQNQ